MERNTRKILEYKKKLKFKQLQELFNKKKKEVNINEFGSHRYMIKEGVNKGKIL